MAKRIEFEEVENLIQTRSCTNKVRYGSKRSATLALIEMERKYKVPFVWYPCFFCKGFHVAKAKEIAEKR
jgi:hypothetical protein